MRLLELRLLAFGPFTDKAIDLSAPGLHVVYGPNEAGKSTALRAIGALLFGIEERTPDAYLHAYDKLRVGAIITSEGERLEIVRLKKRKHALIDPSGAPIDERRLERFLGGVTPALFGSMFGLDHQSLRRGAQALLRGEGDLGESLFDAGGARGVGAILEGLRGEAEAIFKPRGQKQALNAALSALKETRDAVKLRSVEPKAVTEQRQGLAEAEARRSELASRKGALEAERLRLGRLERALPLLARRRELVQARADLGPVPRLPDDAAEQRLAAERELDRADRDAARISAEIQQREENLVELVVDEGLLALGSLAEIEERLGRHRSAIADRPKREGELRAREREVHDKLRALGRSDLPAVDRPAQKRATHLARQHEVLTAQLEGAERSLRERQRELDALVIEDPPPAAEPLEVALRGARRCGDIDAQIDALEAAQAESQSLSRALEAELGGQGQRLPSREDVARELEAARVELARAEKLDERRRGLDEELARIEAELSALTLSGSIPTPETLAEARRLRDAALQERELHVAHLAQRIQEADGVADRMFREAERVTRHAQLLAERQRLARLVAGCEAEQAEAKARRMAHERRLEASWPAPAETIIGHLEAHDRLNRAREAERVRGAELASARARRARAVAALSDALGAEGEGLASLVDRAEARLDEHRARAARRAQRHEARAQTTAAVTTLASERDARRLALDEWRREWASAMARLDLPFSTSCEEALDLLDALRELAERELGLSEIRRRIAGMDRDAQELEALVRPLVAQALPEQVARPVGEAAERLLEAVAQARIAASRREQLSQEITSRKSELSATKQSSAAAEENLAASMRTAGVTERSDLAAAEQRADRARQLDASIAELEATLFHEGSLEELEALGEGRDLDEVRARHNELSGALADLDDELSVLDRDIGAKRLGLERFDQLPGAFGDALELESHLAEIRRLTERWAKLRLAARILEGEIRAYREQNQGPIIDRASELFPRLTLGEYKRLRVDFDVSDEPRLLCVGVDGAEVGVDALSDGARDQLYLALRLASLERYAEHAELLPFVVDDVLVHFDEDRARASIEVLADFSAIGQVLMFTHHARHVELAREALSADRLHVHELSGGHRRARSSGRSS